MAADASPLDDRPLTHALALAALGLRVLPIKPGEKYPPMQSWQNAATTDAETIRNWYLGLYRDHGVGLAMGTQPDGRNIFALDVDLHHPEADGYDTLNALERKHDEPLPDTVVSITGSGGQHQLYDSGAMIVTNGSAARLGPGLDIRGQGGQIVVAPTIHPNGHPYVWETTFAPWERKIVSAPAWFLDLLAPPIVEGVTRTDAVLGPRPDPDRGHPLDTPADQLRAEWLWETELRRRGWELTSYSDGGASTHWTRPGKDPRHGASAVLHNNGAGPFVVFTTDASVTPMWRAGAISADGTCVTLSPLAFFAAYDHDGDLSAAGRALRTKYPTPDPFAALVAAQASIQAPEGVEPDALRSLAKDGATFILDEDSTLEARWGRGSEVLWARGESILLAGPAGVGKTTIAGQLIGGLIGVLNEVLGYPVEPATKVLYLAMDRPRQVRRALRRLFTEDHRQALAERLVVRPGPIPRDLGKSPETLLDLACQHGCDVIVIDSLKDAAIKLTDDEVGGNVNRSVQACNAADVDVLALHHQRKGVGGDKPTTLEDVYGSTWLTAGAGSVVLLWGEAGSELIELTHLKQPADPLGPFTIEHDHHHGMSIITRGFDALAFLRLQGSSGATVAEASHAEHGTPQSTGSAKWKKTERRLRALARAGLATTDGRPRVGVAARFYAVDVEHLIVSSMDNPHGQGGPEKPTDNPMDNPCPPMDIEQETPGQTMDTSMDTQSPVLPMDISPPYKAGGNGRTDLESDSPEPFREPLL